VNPARFVLPAAAGGVAAGILGADQASLPPTPWLVGVSGVLAIAAFVASTRSAVGAALLVCAVLLAAAALGGWRHESTDPARPMDRPSVAVLAGSEEAELTGTVADDPRPREDRLQLVLGDVSAEAGDRRLAFADRLLVWTPRGIGVASGDRVVIRSRVELAEDFDGFAYREYLARQGVGAIARARTLEIIAPGSGPAAALAGARSTLLGGLNAIVPEPEAALGAGILLGVRAAIAPEISDAFATAGLTHVVAISGWNIAIVAALVAAMAQPLARRPGGRWASACVAVVTVAAYVILTGASPSVVRASLMAGCMLVARMGGSRAHAASALELAALVMLLAAPPVLWDVGFQLSLLATAGLIWFGASVERRLPRWPAWVREPVALTMAAQLTTLPVILVNFERLSLVAPLANVLVVPFVPVAMLLSAVASVVGVATDTVALSPITDVAAWLAGGAAWLVLRVIVLLGTAVASVPHAAVPVTIPAPLAIAWLPILGLGTWALRSDAPSDDPAGRSPEPSRLGRVLRPLPITAALVAVLVAITVASGPDGRLHVTVLDIGQGDAILVETPSGRTVLVDGGPDPERTLRHLGANLPFSARRIDLVVLSHPHQDHIAGLLDVLHRYRVGGLLHAGIDFENAAYRQLLTDTPAEPGLTVALGRAGQRISLDDRTSIEVLYPTESDARSPLPEGDINNGSIVLVLRFGAFAALLTGDAEAPVESALVDRGVIPAIDLLKVGHHGSRSSTTAGLLDAARPTAAVISSGDGNEYGHPAPETLATLAARPEIAVFRTDRDGDVELATDGATYRVRTDAGWTEPRMVHGGMPTASIAPWPFPIEAPRDACSTTRDCPRASSSTPRAWLASPWPPRGSSPSRGFQSTARWSRRPRCCMTLIRSRSGDPAASTGSSALGGSRRRATRSSRCRSPPIPSARSSTTIAFRSAGRRSWWPSPTGTWRRNS
jgi:competence protein ComEC